MRFAIWVLNILLKGKISACVECGKYYPPSKTLKKVRMYCSRYCSQQPSKRKFRKDNPFLEKECLVCRTIFKPKRTGGTPKYCSDRCCYQMQLKRYNINASLKRVYEKPLSVFEVAQLQWDSGAWKEREIKKVERTDNKELDLADIMEDVFDGNISVSISYNDFLEIKGLTEEDVDKQTFEDLINQIKESI